MEDFKRFAIYYAPPPGAFAKKAAHWLGWDPVLGQSCPQPDLDGVDLAALTAEPRKYGFHGTIRAPFRPAEGLDLAEIETEIAALAARLSPVSCAGLRLENLDGFLAFTPESDGAALMQLAAAVVEGTDGLRAPLTAVELARRRPETLSDRQRALLLRWGYPGVMEEFRFHLTLTGRLPPESVATVTHAAEQYFAAVLPRPFVIEDLCLFGEDAEGRFHLLHRHPLTG